MTNENISTKEPPHSIELEKSILATLLAGTSAASMQIVREVIAHPLAFFMRDHRLIYQACLDLDDQGERIETTAVMEHLRNSATVMYLDRLRRLQILQESLELDKLQAPQLHKLHRSRPEDSSEGHDDSVLAAIGGFQALATLANRMTSTVGIRKNAETLWDYYLKRILIRSLTSISDSTYQTTDPFGELIDRTGQMVLGLSRLGGSRSVHQVSDVVDESLDTLITKQQSQVTDLRTGFDRLDERLNTLRPCGLYVLAARPGVGKTSFALNMIQNILRPDGQHILFFSLEVGRTDLINKLLSGYSRTDFRKIEAGMLLPEEIEAIRSASAKLKSLPLSLMDVSDISAAGMRSAAKRYMLECDLGLIVLDYLQLLKASKHGQSEYEKVSEISRTLKVMAMELEIPILAISQLSRESDRGNAPREPRLSDLRGSGCVEQDADAVIFLHQVDGDDKDREIKVTIAKNRFGPIGYETMRFLPSIQRFETQSRGATLAQELAPTSPADDDRYWEPPTDDENLFGDMT